MRGYALLTVFAAAVGWAGSEAAAQRLVGETAKVAEFPVDWGDNVIAATQGATIADQSPAEKPENDARCLIDGDVAAGDPQWNVRPQGGGPKPFAVLRWEKARVIDRIAFYNDMRLSKDAAKEVVVTLSEDGQNWGKPHTCSLRQVAGAQSYEVNPPERAKFIRFEVASNWGGTNVILEEAAAFEGRASRAGMYRGTNTQDIMELKNGDVLTGLIKNETIEIQTSYAKLIFRAEEIANIMFEGTTTNIERITMVNGDTFSGFILTKDLLLVLDKGNEVRIRKDKVGRLGMRLRPGERRSRRGDVIFLKNGDIFAGKVLNPSLTIKTSYATLTNQVADIARIEFTGDSRIVTKVTLKNDNTMQGLLEEDDIEIELDSGPTVLVYKDKIDKIEMRR